MDRTPTQSHRVALAAVALAASAAVLAGCSSSPKSPAGKHATKPSTTVTTGVFGTTPQDTTPSSTASPPIEVAGVVVELNGSTAEVDFTSPAVTGTPTAVGGTFTNAGKTLSFSITGVTYKGGPVTTAGSPVNHIVEALVTPATNGVSVKLTLSKAASQFHFKSGADKVSVTVS